METVGILVAGVVIGIALTVWHFRDGERLENKIRPGTIHFSSPGLSTGPLVLKKPRAKRKPRVGDDQTAYLAEVEEIKQKQIGG